MNRVWNNAASMRTYYTVRHIGALMRHFISVLCLALLTVSCHCGGVQKAPKTPNPTVAHISSSTVALVYTHVEMPVVDPDAEVDPNAEPVRPVLTVRDICAAVWVSKDVMITARHCVV